MASQTIKTPFLVSAIVSDSEQQLETKTGELQLVKFKVKFIISNGKIIHKL